MDIANITVFFIFFHLIYNEDVKPTELALFMRFVDDGLGIWTGSKDSFISWFTDLKKSCNDRFNIDLTFNVYAMEDFAQFLDISLCFHDGVLKTDIYRKPTDANRYLHYTSYHPRHVFRSVIYSQGLGSLNGTFRKRLNDLKTFLRILLIKLRL